METGIRTGTRTGIGRNAVRYVAALAIMVALPGSLAPLNAQSRPLVLSPTPDGGAAAGPFCYYAGLSYSPGSVITVKVPVRREVVTDRPRQELRCEVVPTAPGSVSWVEVDPDEGDPFRD